MPCTSWINKSLHFMPDVWYRIGFPAKSKQQRFIQPFCFPIWCRTLIKPKSGHSCVCQAEESINLTPTLHRKSPARGRPAIQPSSPPWWPPRAFHPLSAHKSIARFCRPRSWSEYLSSQSSSVSEVKWSHRSLQWTHSQSLTCNNSCNLSAVPD